MPKFKVDWAKTYRMTGSCEIEAKDAEAAEIKMSFKIRDMDGKLQYMTGRNSIHAVKTREDEKC